MKKALILGVGGQDGSYLAEILLVAGYRVHGLYRHSSGNNLHNIDHIKHNLVLHKGDITDYPSLCELIRKEQFDEIYNEADQDNVDWSFQIPSYTIDVTVKGVSNLLEAVRRYSEHSKVFIPCSAMMFGDAPAPQNELTPFNPQSPYACGKVSAYYLARYYRSVYKMWVTTAILYNHDSPRRTGDYLLHRIVKAAVKSEHEPEWNFHIGNVDEWVSIGDAHEYMRGVYNSMQLDTPDDFVIGTEWCSPIRTIIEIVYSACGLDYRNHVVTNQSSHRPGKTQRLRADCSKARQSWQFGCTYDATRHIPALIQRYRKEYKCALE